MTQSALFEKLCSEEHLLSAWEYVKAKKAMGGIDGESVIAFSLHAREGIKEIRTELLSATWKPQPYLKIEIPKKRTEKRRIGLLCVKDKIVQQAIRMLLEPICEQQFFPESYGYRPGKGAVAAIYRTHHLCHKFKGGSVLSLDIDNYFDNVNHDILSSLLSHLLPGETEIIRLIMLSVKMGMVTAGKHWVEIDKGLPQGAVLSPCLANLYLHDFDKTVLGLTKGYVRYADDFVVFFKTREAAQRALGTLTNFLEDERKLSLNPVSITSVAEGFVFLGVRLDASNMHLSERKKQDILNHISSFYLEPGGLEKSASKRWDGIYNYYGKILPEDELQVLDQALYDVLEKNIGDHWNAFAGKTALQASLSQIRFMCRVFRQHDTMVKDTLVRHYLSCSGKKEVDSAKEKNRKIILQRKHEYRRLEVKDSEIVVTKRGVALGLAKNRVTMKENGFLVASIPVANLKHITILSDGVSLSSNLLNYLMGERIPMDFFGRKGVHLGAFISAASLQCGVWREQMLCTKEKRNCLAGLVMEGKVVNQLNLIKYYHKYHKSQASGFQPLLDELDLRVKTYKMFLGEKSYASEMFMDGVTAHESQCALAYWDYVRAMLSDDHVGFLGRSRQGASDLVNCLLNYGYAILYSRVWQVLLRVGLNPYDSLIHVRQSGKPTFVYDVVEIFRAQAVDRVVFSLVQKGEPLAVKEGRLEDSTKALLVKNISERFQAREKYRGEEMTFETILLKQAQEIAEYYVSDKSFKPYKAKW